MTQNAYPRLCGGTFFTLLLQARQQRRKAREHIKGERDGLSETDTLVGLIKIINPDYIEPTTTSISTFRGNTSDFKSCKKSGNTYMPFGNSAEISTFDNRIKTDYVVPFQATCSFIDAFLDVGTSPEKDLWLVKALLELIEKDQSIADDQGFCICENGSKITKAALRSATDICLPSFLLGIWHFVLVDRKDNTVGRATYDDWCPPNNHSSREYKGNIGDGIAQNINVTLCNNADSKDNGNSSIVEDEESPSDVDCDEANINDPINQPYIEAISAKLIDVFEDALDKYHVAEFVDSDFTAMPLHFDHVVAIDEFVAFVRDTLRIFRRKQDSTYKYVIDFINVIEHYTGYLATKMISEDGNSIHWLPNVDWFEIHEYTLNFRRQLNKLYGLISNGGTLSVFGYSTPENDEDAKSYKDSDSPETDNLQNDSTTESTSKATNQTVNNPIVFNQHGNNNVQIGSVDTLTIKND